MQSIHQVALVVRDYDDALDLYVGTLGFTLVEDTYIPEQDKRWVVVAPPGSKESRLLQARAVGEEQASNHLNKHEMVLDEIAGTPILVTY